MSIATKSTHASGAKAFEEKIKAQVKDAQTILEQFEAKAKEKRTEAEITAAIATLKSAKQDIDRRLHDLNTTHETHVTRAKSEIEADVAKFAGAIALLGARFKSNKK
ncbi:MAG TPA: hypothetical protein VKE51_14020 [Vicinamibacterales bacterium]|nr:hypothetical protein [Vicinamibacterales bacterium]